MLIQHHSSLSGSSMTQGWSSSLASSSLYNSLENAGCFFFTGTPQFQCQKENPPSSQSRFFLVRGFTGTAVLIGWLAVFFLVLKLGGTSEEKKYPGYRGPHLYSVNLFWIDKYENQIRLWKLLCESQLCIFSAESAGFPWTPGRSGKVISLVKVEIWI